MCAFVARRPSPSTAKAVPTIDRRLLSSIATAYTDRAAIAAICSTGIGVRRYATKPAAAIVASTAAAAVASQTRRPSETTNRSSPKATTSPVRRRQRCTGAPFTKVPLVDPESTIHHAPRSFSASAWRPLEKGVSVSVRTRLFVRLRPMRTRGPEKISSSPRRGPLSYRNRSRRTLLLADGVFRCRRARELDDRELVLHLDDRAGADLLLGRAELRAGVRVDQRVADVDDGELVAHLDSGRGAKVDVRPVAFDLDDLALDKAARVRRVGNPREVLAAHEFLDDRLGGLVDGFARDAPLRVAAERRVLHEAAPFFHLAVAGNRDDALRRGRVNHAQVDRGVRLPQVAPDAQSSEAGPRVVDVELIDAAQDDVFDPENLADLRRARRVDGAGLSEPLLLQHQVQLVALDDAEFSREELVLRERGVDDVAGRGTHLVPVPVCVRRVVVELPDGHFDLALRVGLRRENENERATDPERTKQVPHLKPPSGGANQSRFLDATLRISACPRPPR